jgi:hypothetical protein
VFFSSQDDKLTKSIELTVPIVLTTSEILAPTAQDSPPSLRKSQDEIHPKEKKHKSGDGKVTPRPETSMSEGKLECTETVTTKAQETIATITIECKNQQLRLEELKKKQERISTKNDTIPLAAEYDALQLKITTGIEELLLLQQTIVLTAFELFDVLQLNGVLHQQRSQIVLNQKELKSLGSER